jgi:transcriptional regulator with XRE-family HTH domain
MLTTLNAKRQKKYKTNANRVKGLMLLQGIEPKDASRRLGISKTYLSYVLHGDRRGEWVRRKLAAMLNLPYEKLWGKEKEKA